MALFYYFCCCGSWTQFELVHVARLGNSRWSEGDEEEKPLIHKSVFSFWAFIQSKSDEYLLPRRPVTGSARCFAGAVIESTNYIAAFQTQASKQTEIRRLGIKHDGNQTAQAKDRANQVTTDRTWGRSVTPTGYRCAGKQNRGESMHLESAHLNTHDTKHSLRYSLEHKNKCWQKDF